MEWRLSKFVIPPTFWDREKNLRNMYTGFHILDTGLSMFQVFRTSETEDC